MIEKISDSVELDFLRIMGIELKNNKLVKVATGEEFVHIKPEEINRSGDFYFKCGDTTVIFNVLMSGDSIRVTLQEGNVTYCALKYKYRSENDMIESGRELLIKEKNKENPIKIIVKPQYDDIFIKTTITKGSGVSPDDFFFGIECSFSSINLNPNYIDFWEYTNRDLSLENYQSILEGIFYNENLEAYLKCIPFLCNGYTELLDFPAKYSEKFEEYFDSHMLEIKRDFKERMKTFNSKRALYNEYIAKYNSPKTNDNPEKQNKQLLKKNKIIGHDI